MSKHCCACSCRRAVCVFYAKAWHVRVGQRVCSSRCVEDGRSLGGLPVRFSRRLKAAWVVARGAGRAHLRATRQTTFATCAEGKIVLGGDNAANVKFCSLQWSNITLYNIPMSHEKSSGLRGERAAGPNIALHFTPYSLVRPGSLAGPATRALVDLHGFHDHHAVVVAPAHLVALVHDLGGLQVQLPVNQSRALSGPEAACHLSNQGGWQEHELALAPWPAAA